MNSMNWNRGMLIYFRMDDCGWSSLSTFPPFHLSSFPAFQLSIPSWGPLNPRPSLLGDPGTSTTPLQTSRAKSNSVPVKLHQWMSWWKHHGDPGMISHPLTSLTHFILLLKFSWNLAPSGNSVIPGPVALTRTMLPSLKNSIGSRLLHRERRLSRIVFMILQPSK